MLSLFVVLVIFFEAILCRGTSTSVKGGFKAGQEKAEITLEGFFSSLPLIIFSYMYQVNVPGIYQELEQKNLLGAKKVLGFGTLLAAVVYVTAGIFGYITFAENSSKEEL